MKKHPYVTAPDGLVARDVGPWVRDKVHYVDRYAQIFATGMKYKWPRRAYVELFSGPGISWERTSREFIDGSALRALSLEFTDYVYVDQDPVARDALVTRVAERVDGARSVVLPAADCNASIEQVRAEVPSRALTLAFVDPTTWQVRLDSIARLVEGRNVDLLMTFHTGTMRRMKNHRAKPRAIDEFFGTDRWRACLDLPKDELPGALIKVYNEQLEPLGYLSDCHLYTERISNSRHVHMYQLVMFTRDARGLDFWQKAIAKARDLQLWR